MTDEPERKPKHRNYKTRDNYSTGGWCPKSNCAWREHWLNPDDYAMRFCDTCVRYSQYVRKL